MHRSLLFVFLVLAPAVALAQAPSTIRATVVDAQSHPVADAVVVAVSTDPSVNANGHPRAESLDQIDKEFVPKVKAVFVGSTVAFPNKDSVRHHVYSFSPAKRFELPLYAGVPSQPVLFDWAGVVVLGCNIHDWMVGYIYVSESPWFASTSADGRATLALPPRAYVVRVWHPQLVADEASTRKPVEVAPGATAHVRWSVEIKPEVRVRRAPAAAHGGHY